MIVYRLEDRFGRGPFATATRWPDVALRSDNNLHSHYACTVTIRASYGLYRFGCRNITGLRRYWGKDSLKAFEREGWRIVKYKVRKNYIKFGMEDIELAFKADKAERIAA